MKVSAEKQSQSQQKTSLNLSPFSQHEVVNQAVPRLLQVNAEERKVGSNTSAITRFTHDFSQIPVYSKAPVRLQAKLKVSVPGDVYEQEADRIADQVMAMPAHPAVSEAPPHIQRLAGQPIGQMDAMPASVDETLASPGRPLEPALRQDMEQRFGQDFSRVRVHSDAAAERSAREVNAHAYTMGSHIVFGAGRFAPATREGRLLLAHELTHVVQQSSGDVFLGKKGPKDDPDKIVSKKIRIPPGTTSVQEFRRYAEAIIFGRVLNLKWEAQGKLAGMYSDITQHIGKEVTFSFPASVIASQVMGSDADKAAAQATAVHDYAELGDEERQDINAEIDKRYYASIEEETETKIKPGEAGKIAIWNSFRQQVLADKRKIEALPEDIKSILFAGDSDSPVLTPDNYTQVLRIAQKLATLKPEERKDYLARINASTTSLDTLESSINSYQKFLAQREKEEKKLDTAAKPLLGAENLYTRVKNYKKFKRDAEMAHLLGESGQHQAAEHLDEIDEGLRVAEAELLAALKQKNFNSIEEFDASIEAYRVAFRTQAVTLALDVLAHYDHMLFEERKKFQQPGVVAGIAQKIAATKASALYEEASIHRSTASNLQSFHEPRETAWIEPARKAKDLAAQAHAEAESEVKRVSGDHPLIAERGTDREKLAKLDAQGLESYLFELLDKRAADVREARQDFKDDPDRVFNLPDLVAATKEIQSIDSSTIYGQIIDDYISDEAAKHFLSQIVIGIFALALAFVIPVGGGIAAAAIIGTAAISTYQAYAAYKEYEEQERDYNLHFLRDEPSLFWVGLAIVAAAFDLGVVASTLIKESAVALKALEGPMLEFSKLEVKTESDLAKLVSKIEAAEGLKAEVKVALEREAKASMAAKEALKDFGGKAYSFMPGAEIGLAVQGFARALPLGQTRHQHHHQVAGRRQIYRSPRRHHADDGR